jgi:ribosomal protein L11 methyltransferase
MFLQQLHVTTDQQHAEIIGDMLTTMGALAITFYDAANQAIFEPDPETIPIWQQTRVVALFENNVDLKKIFIRLQNQFPETSLIFHSEILQDKDWLSESQKNFHPMRFGKRLWIYPSWEQPKLQQGVMVNLDPGIAFGTGTHPTTALCLEWLDQNIKKTDRIIDYGCGSGILAIAAIKLSARFVWAIDHDFQAIEATQKNAQKNAIAKHQLKVTLPDLLPSWQADVLIANILAQPLIKLSTKFAKLITFQGKIVLSGILREQTETILKIYQPQFTITEVTYRDDWVRIVGIKN